MWCLSLLRTLLTCPFSLVFCVYTCPCFDYYHFAHTHIHTHTHTSTHTHPHTHTHTHKLCTVKGFLNIEVWKLSVHKKAFNVKYIVGCGFHIAYSSVQVQLKPGDMVWSPKRLKWNVYTYWKDDRSILLNFMLHYILVVMFRNQYFLHLWKLLAMPDNNLLTYSSMMSLHINYSVLNL